MRSRSLRCKNLEVYATAIVMGLPAAGLLVTVFALSSHLLYLALRFSPLLLFGYVLTLPLIGGMLLLGRPVVHALCAPLEITCNEHYLEVRCLLRRVRMSANAITAVYTENAITDHPWFDHLWLWRSRWVYDTWILPADGWVCLHRTAP
ncbi:MAG TPA: hypothetical protein VHV83_02160 [Armatimonadota bacterium]|nr:hypothetical protein [Armatimonadota bacterium]